MNLLPVDYNCHHSSARELGIKLRLLSRQEFLVGASHCLPQRIWHPIRRSLKFDGRFFKGISQPPREPLFDELTYKVSIGAMAIAYTKQPVALLLMHEDCILIHFRFKAWLVDGCLARARLCRILECCCDFDRQVFRLCQLVPLVETELLRYGPGGIWDELNILGISSCHPLCPRSLLDCVIETQLLVWKLQFLVMFMSDTID